MGTLLFSKEEKKNEELIKTFELSPEHSKTFIIQATGGQITPQYVLFNLTFYMIELFLVAFGLFLNLYLSDLYFFCTSFSFLAPVKHFMKIHKML